MKAQAPGTPDLAARACRVPGHFGVANVARVWWWCHVHVENRTPLSLGAPRAASMRAASAAAAKASGASEAPFCKACRNSPSVHYSELSVGIRSCPSF